MLKRLAPLLLGLVIGCAPAAPVGGPVAPAPGPARLATAVPDQVGALRKTDTHAFPQAEAGTLYRFRGDGSLEPDVYVYPVSPDTRGKGPGPETWVAAEGPYFQAALSLQQQQGRLESFRVVADSAVRLTAGSAPVAGWHTAARLMVRGQPRDSHQLLFGVGDHFVKVRATFAAGSVTDAELRGFTQALMEQLVAR